MTKDIIIKKLVNFFFIEIVPYIMIINNFFFSLIDRELGSVQMIYCICYAHAL